MADNMVSEIQADFLSCKLCKQPFNHPKALSCQHTFCKGCLIHHVQKNGVTNKDGSHCVFCPTCTQICDLPMGGVEGLQDNHLLRNLLDMMNSKCLQRCSLCQEEGEDHAATYCCIKCEDFLCDECAKMHKRTRITKDHLVVNVGAMMDICRGLQGKESASKINARLLTQFGRHGDVLFHPFSICVNMADDILVSNDNNTISVFSLSGVCKKVIDQQTFYGQKKHSLPNRGIAVTTEGYVIVAMRKDLTPQMVHMGVIESLAGREISILTGKIKHPTDCQPHGVAVTSDNHIIISDAGRHCVYIFDAEMQLVRQFGKKGSKGRRQFKCPYYVAATPDGDIVVSDYGNCSVKTFDMKGKPKLLIGGIGRGPGEFMHPMGVCVDRYGNIFVADRDNHRVQMFNKYGAFLSFIISRTCKDGKDIRPHDVAMTTYGHLTVLLRGIEGVDMAEIHVYQYGSASSHPKDRSSSTGPSTKGGRDPEKEKSTPPRRLAPLDHDERPVGGRNRPNKPPDLLPQEDDQRQNGTVRGKDNGQLAALLASAACRHETGSHSQVCTIL